DVARERLDVLELEARELAHDPGTGPNRQRDLAQRHVLVAGEHRVDAGGGEHRAEQADRGRLALRPGDAEHGVALEQAKAELDLAPDRDAALTRGCGHRRPRRHPGALHDQVDSLQYRSVLRSETQFDAGPA